MDHNQIKNFLTIRLCITCILFSSCSIVSEDKGYHTYEFTGGTGGEDFLVDFFTLNLVPESRDPGFTYVDRLHELNPDVFVLTNLTESVLDGANKKYFIKSPNTGKVYECKLKKGTKIRTVPIRD